jgi:putative RNA 2'-phosphotransferase
MQQIVNSLPNHLLGFSNLPNEFLAELVEHVLWQRVQLFGENIRATYGHTTPLLDPVDSLIPDSPLFRGTSWELWLLIKHVGLAPAGRRFVQITTDFDYANRIARGRSANPLVLQVATQAALDVGVKFFNFGIHVWQYTAIPSCCLQAWTTHAPPNDFWDDANE